MRSIVAASLAIGLLLGASAFLKADVKDDLAALQGGWAMALAFINGEELPADQVKSGSLLIDGDEYNPKLGASVEPSTIKVDGSKNPRSIDFTYTTGFQKGKTTKGIFKLEGDNLTICRGLAPEKDRPAEFAAPNGSGLLLVVWKKSNTIEGEKLKAMQEERKRFEATWIFVSVEAEGRMVPVELLKESKLVLKGKQFTSSINGKTTNGSIQDRPDRETEDDRRHVYRRARQGPKPEGYLRAGRRHSEDLLRGARQTSPDGIREHAVERANPPGSRAREALSTPAAPACPRPRALPRFPMSSIPATASARRMKTRAGATSFFRRSGSVC